VSLSDELESREQDADLRTTNLRLLRQLDKAKASKEELVDAVYRAATDAARSLVIPPVPRPERDRRRGKPEVAVAMLSDWQLGKKTPTYSSEICEQRIAAYAAKVASLADIQRADHPVRELRVWLLGDLVEGELIFPGQSHRIDASLYRQVAVDGPRILAGFLRSMLGAFERVHVTAVIGNHGAIGGPVRREMHPETNADTMLYRIVSQIVVDPRLTWDIADPAGERGWYAIDTDRQLPLPPVPRRPGPGRLRRLPLLRPRQEGLGLGLGRPGGRLQRRGARSLAHTDTGHAQQGDCEGERIDRVRQHLRAGTACLVWAALAVALLRRAHTRPGDGRVPRQPRRLTYHYGSLGYPEWASPASSARSTHEMDGEIPLDADRLPAGVCIGCRQPKEPVRMLPELRAGKGPWCTACLGELVRRAVIAYPQELRSYRAEDAKHRKMRESK
jgi:hypothetical protein